MSRESGDIYDELVQEFYGIDPISSTVENVAITRSGKISRWTISKGYVVHQMAGTDTCSEIARLFGLTELVEVNPRAALDRRRLVMEALQAKISSTTSPARSQ